MKARKAILGGAAALACTFAADGHAQPPSRQAAFIDIVRISTCAHLITALAGEGLWHGGLYEDEYVERMADGDTISFRSKRGVTCGTIRSPQTMSPSDRERFERDFEWPALEVGKVIMSPPTDRAKQEAYLREQMAEADRRYDAGNELPRIEPAIPERALVLDRWLMGIREGSASP